MKGGSVDLAACVGRWDFSVGVTRLLGLSKATDACGTLFSAGRGTAAADIFKTCMVGLCWYWTLAGGWGVHCSLLLFPSRGSSESCELLSDKDQEIILNLMTSKHAGSQTLGEKFKSGKHLHLLHNRCCMRFCFTVSLWAAKRRRFMPVKVKILTFF